MNHLIKTVTVALILVTYFTGYGKACETMEYYNIDSCDYTPCPAIIEQKKQEMLAVDDNESNFIFSLDTELESQDPHAYWLMNRMMQTMRLISTADDAWAWMLAMNGYVKEYNSRLERKIGSTEAATRAMEELISIYHAGNQPEMNTATYVESIIPHYKALYAYRSIIDGIDDYDDDTDEDVYLRRLYYREFTHWFDINNAVNGLMYFYTYGMARYSALPMDINSTFEKWSKARLEELKIEDGIMWYSDWHWKPFNSEARRVSEKKFDRLLKYFKGRTRESIAKDMVSEWVDKDYLYAYERIDGNMSFDKIAEMIGYYETALNGWRQVREEIAQALPKKRQKSYREITRQMHTRLYNDLLDLKEINY